MSDCQSNPPTAACPPTVEGLQRQARERLDEIIAYCLKDQGPASFLDFEAALLGLLRSLGCLLRRRRRHGYPVGTARPARTIGTGDGTPMPDEDGGCRRCLAGLPRKLCGSSARRCCGQARAAQVVIVRLIFITLLALILATVVGLGATWMTATRGTDLGTLTIGAWTARPKTGTADVDPYSRASIARSGELAVCTGIGRGGRGRKEKRINVSLIL